MRECILSSYIFLPKAFWGKKEFQNVFVDADSIKISFDEWMSFYRDVLEMLGGNEFMLKVFFQKMKENLIEYSNIVDRLRNLYKKDKMINSKVLRACFDTYSRCQCYAFFNLLPINLYRKYIADAFLLDTCLISLIGSHRTIRQIKELELAYNFVENKLSQCDIDRYMENEYLLNYEYEWNFYTERQYTSERVMRNILFLSKKYSRDEIGEQLYKYKKKRQVAMKKVYELLIDKYYNDTTGFQQALFLLNVATQEEIRHIINVRFMNIIGEIAYELGIDIARTSSEDFLRMVIY